MKLFKFELPLLSIVIMILAFSCNNEGSGPQKSSQVQDGEKTTSQKLDMKRFKNSMASNVSYEGTIIEGRAWEDSNGKNFVIFTQKQEEKEFSEGPSSRSIYLYAYHFADKGEGYKEIGKIQDWQKDCGLAITAEFRPKSINITDLDGNGFAEITFVYWLHCSGDLSQMTMKLMMLENGKKYPMRGITAVPAGYISENETPGTRKAGKEFKNTPAVFLDFANKIWDANQYFPEK